MIDVETRVSNTSKHGRDARRSITHPHNPPSSLNFLKKPKLKSLRNRDFGILDDHLTHPWTPSHTFITFSDLRAGRRKKNSYSVFESFEDNAAQEYQLPPACLMANSRNLVPISLKNPVPAPLTPYSVDRLTAIGLV